MWWYPRNAGCLGIPSFVLTGSHALLVEDARGWRCDALISRDVVAAGVSRVVSHAHIGSGGVSFVAYVGSWGVGSFRDVSGLWREELLVRLQFGVQKFRAAGVLLLSEDRLFALEDISLSEFVLAGEDVTRYLASRDGVSAVFVGFDGGFWVSGFDCAGALLAGDWGSRRLCGLDVSVPIWRREDVLEAFEDLGMQLSFEDSGIADDDVPTVRLQISL